MTRTTLGVITKARENVVSPEHLLITRTTQQTYRKLFEQFRGLE